MLTSRFHGFSQLLLIVIFLCISSARAEEYRIVTTWDNRTINHPDRPVVIQLEKHNDSFFKIDVDAPFFNDPPKPNGQVGEPFFKLWDYEVVEVFFLNGKNDYVEIELCPWGQHIVLLLSGQRNTIRHSLFIEFTATRKNGTWQGVASIPTGYLPPNVTKMNAYAIHGSDQNRVYESLYPVAFDSTSAADFHNLAAFQPFDRTIILDEDVNVYSDIWMDSLTGSRSLEIQHTWNGTLLSQKDAVKLELQVRSSLGLTIQIDAPFYKDPIPPSPSGWPFTDLSSYEVVHFLLLAENDTKTLELQFGPWGQYAVVFWSGSTKFNDLHREIIYRTDRSDTQRWIGEVIVPFSYLPARVYKCNAHSAHGPQGHQRHINSLYPAQSTEMKPDFQNYGNYKVIDMTMIYPGNDNVTCSDVWADKIDDCWTKNAGHATTAQFALLLVVAFTSSFVIVA